MPFCPVDGKVMILKDEGLWECPNKCARYSDGVRSSPEIDRYTYSHTVDVVYSGSERCIRAISAGQGELWVVCNNPGGVYRIRNNTVTEVIPSKYSNEVFSSVTHSKGNKIFLGTINKKILIVEEGKGLREWNNGGIMRKVTSLCSDEFGFIYYAESDIMMAQVVILNNRGVQQAKLGSFKRSLSLPVSVTTGPADGVFGQPVYVLDQNQKQLVCFARNGTRLWTYPTNIGADWKPVSIARPPKKSYLAIACQRSNKILFFDAVGNRLKNCEISLKSDTPSAICFDEKGNLYVGMMNLPKTIVFCVDKSKTKQLNVKAKKEKV